MQKNKSRRNFLGQAALGVAGLATASAMSPDRLMIQDDRSPKLYQAKPLKDSLFTMEGISKRTMVEHEKLYRGYVNKSNEILGLLRTVDHSKANQTYSDLRALKVELTFAVGGVKNHEIYFSNLGGKGGRPEGALASQIQKDFESFENWEKDFKASGLAARGWVWLAYDLDIGTLFNYIGDAQNTFPVWNAVPILALDVYEHAYFIDKGADRKGYIEIFIKNLDWQDVQQRFLTIPGIKG